MAHGMMCVMVWWLAMAMAMAAAAAGRPPGTDDSLDSLDSHSPP